MYAEVLPGTILVEIVGDRRVLIENHGGIKVYSCNEITVASKNGVLCVTGQDLTIARMTKEQLVITGKIDGVQLFGEN